MEKVDIYDENSVVTAPQETFRTDLAKFSAKTYLLMGIGLAVSFLVAILTAYAFPQLFNSFGLVMGLMIAELAVALLFSFCFRRASYPVVLTLYLLYSVLTGVSFSAVFLYFDLSTFYLAFGATAATFVVMSIIGFTTKKSLSNWGSVLLGGLIALIIVEVIALFVGGWLDMIVCGVGVLLFMLITAYDTRRIRDYAQSCYSKEEADKASLYCAMQLYLDFINILWYLLRLFARTRD